MPPAPPQVVEIDFTKEFRVTLTYLVICLLSVGLVCFWGFHTYLLAFNYTTIEFLEKRGCNPPPDHVNRYNVGMWGNIASVSGATPRHATPHHATHTNATRRTRRAAAMIT